MVKLEKLSDRALTELEDSSDHFVVKIGYSKDISVRISQLSTGNPRGLVLMGYVKTSDRDEDRVIESRFHEMFSDRRRKTTEWFNILPEDVLAALHCYSPTAYLAVGCNPFEIVSYDRKGIPEFADPWRWQNVEPDEFCPACGWACGWAYSENWGCNVCIECGANEIQYEDAARFRCN
ncbi:GIY-YIG nuclease family protein [Novacetimonas hansenii]